MRPPLFVELFAGTAALSLALQARARPPVSRMGRGSLRVGFNGIELNPAYAAMATRRIEDDAPLFNVAGCAAGEVRC